MRSPDRFTTSPNPTTVMTVQSRSSRPFDSATRLTVRDLSLPTLTALALLVTQSQLLIADQASWPEFRGGTGLAAQGTLPNAWTSSQYEWVIDLGSRDVGSPVVWDERVFLLRSDEKASKLMLDCFDLASGNRIWAAENNQTSMHLHKRNTAASSTPSVDSKHVYIAYAEPKHTYLVAYDHDGHEVWRRDFGSWQSQHGFGASPKIVGDAVVLMNSQQGEQLRPNQQPGRSRLIAVAADTGQDVWQTPLTTTRSCYGIPTVRHDDDGNVSEIIAANTGDGLFAVSPQTGTMLWSYKAFDKRVCSSPLVHGDLVIGTCGSGGGGNQLVAIDVSGNEPTEAYRLDRFAPYVPTPVIKNGLLFAIDDRGIASCHDALSGQRLWSKRIGGNFGASPIIIGDRILMIDLSGNATIVSADRQPAIVAEFDLGGPVGATPAVAGNRLLIRIGTRLVCLSLAVKA